MGDWTLIELIDWLIDYIFWGGWQARLRQDYSYYTWPICYCNWTHKHTHTNTPNYCNPTVRWGLTYQSLTHNVYVTWSYAVSWRTFLWPRMWLCVMYVCVTKWTKWIIMQCSLQRSTPVAVRFCLHLMVELLCSPLLLNTNYVVEKWILLYIGNNWTTGRRSSRQFNPSCTTHKHQASILSCIFILSLSLHVHV